MRYPPDKPPLVVKWPARFDTIRVPVANLEGRTELTMVLSDCGRSAKPFVCDAHGQTFRTIGDLLEHLSPGGTHSITSWCKQHGVYEAVASDTVPGWKELEQQAALLLNDPETTHGH